MAMCGALALTGTQVASAAPRPGDPLPRPEATHQTITLVTGDVVRLERLAGGRRTATVEPGPGRESVTFLQQEVDGALSVIPRDVLPGIVDGRLDPALFDVDELVAQGYTDEQVDTLPLILTYGDDLTAAAAPAAATLGATLTSIKGRAVRADKERATTFWTSVQAGGVDRIALDRRVRANLETSVPMIGAPRAWEAGYDGTGVTVAVLDTGYDSEHPDLKGVVAGSANFTDSPDTGDKFGHGTHVAATVAGTGAASGGARKGVAPGADLIVGKVLGDDGFGLESWVMDGMEWAATSGADVVNMSLGGGGDGTDPLSLAVNALTAQTGTLFVVSAGNDGEQGMSTVGSPGNADAALTVGAVDRQEVLASFSSKGPRPSDLAVKPDITAPGVDIVAARAAGTSMGHPVDEHYTSASGTSMAAPHVAGAAAILAQRHPDWSGPRLKDALASTAHGERGQSVFEHGGGRVDVARAVDQGVYATGTLDLGEVIDGGEPVRRQVSYTNTSDKPVTLALDLDVRSIAGEDPGQGVRIGQSTVEVAAGGNATVEVVADPAGLKPGVYGGRLTATAGDVVVHTSVGANKAVPTHKVTISATGRDGGPVFTPLVAIYGQDWRFDVLDYINPDSSVTVEVPEGVNYLTALVETPSEEVAHQFVVPDFEVTGDMSYVLDVEDTTQVQVETPKPATQQGVFSFYAYRQFGSRSIQNHVLKYPGTRELWVTPASRPDSGELEFGARWSLLAPQLTARTKNGKKITVLPRYAAGDTPKLVGTRTGRLVSAGSGTPEEFASADFRGGIALVDPPKPGGWHDTTQLAALAAKAGAAMVLVTDPVPGLRETAAGTSDPGEPTVTVATVTAKEGAALAAALERGRVTLEVTGIDDSPYLYDVMQVENGEIPGKVVHRVSTRNSATVRTAYHESGGEHLQKEQRFGWRPWQDTAINHYQRRVVTPKVREETVTAGDTIWQHRVRHFDAWGDSTPLTGGMTQRPRSYRPGQSVEESWYAPVVRPAIPRGVAGIESTRVDDTLSVRIPEFVDSGTTHYGFMEGGDGDDPGDEVSARLYRDGELVVEAPDAWREFPASPDPATYRLELSTARTSAEWTFGTRTETAWTFASRRSDGTALLPMPQVDYALETDLSNRMPADRRATIGLTVRHQDGLDGPPVRSVSAWVSYDDGKTWTRATVDRRGERIVATVTHPPLKRTNGFVALRVLAADAAGNAVDQTVTRAYGLH
jgi:subtilisin family serine protease